MTHFGDGSWPQRDMGNITGSPVLTQRVLGDPLLYPPEFKRWLLDWMGTQGVKPLTTSETTWHAVGGTDEPAFANSWVNSGGGSVPARFRKLANSLVVVQGLIKSGTVTSAAFTLPVSYRPALPLLFATTSNSLFGSLTVNADGTVVPTVGSNVSFCINCSFIAEQ